MIIISFLHACILCYFPPLFATPSLAEADYETAQMMTIFFPGCINSFCFVPALLSEGSSAGNTFTNVHPLVINGFRAHRSFWWTWKNYTESILNITKPNNLDLQSRFCVEKKSIFFDLINRAFTSFHLTQTSENKLICAVPAYEW